MNALGANDDNGSKPLLIPNESIEANDNLATEDNKSSLSQNDNSVIIDKPNPSQTDCSNNSSGLFAVEAEETTGKTTSIEEDNNNYLWFLLSYIVDNIAQFPTEDSQFDTIEGFEILKTYVMLIKDLCNFLLIDAAFYKSCSTLSLYFEKLYNKDKISYLASVLRFSRRIPENYFFYSKNEDINSKVRIAGENLFFNVIKANQQIWNYVNAKFSDDSDHSLCADVKPSLTEEFRSLGLYWVEFESVFLNNICLVANELFLDHKTIKN